MPTHIAVPAECKVMQAPASWLKQDQIVYIHHMHAGMARKEWPCSEFIPVWSQSMHNGPLHYQQRTARHQHFYNVCDRPCISSTTPSACMHRLRLTCVVSSLTGNSLEMTTRGYVWLNSALRGTQPPDIFSCNYMTMIR